MWTSLVEGLLDIWTPFLTCLLLAVHYTHQYMLCIVAIVDIRHAVHYKVIRTYHILLLLLTIRVICGFLQGLGNIAQDTATFDSRSVTASFGHGNS